MPELPEVELTRRQLRAAMERARFDQVVVRRADLRYPLPADFAARLQGRTVRALGRRAKYLIVELSSGETLVMHLGMSGSFAVSKGPVAQFDMHDHVVFQMSSGRAVVYNDPRRFGLMRLLEGGLASDPVLGALGAEPLGAAFDARALARALRGRKTTLKAALSDQRVVAGLGNIYVCEALHRARLSPRRRAATLVSRSGAPRPALTALVTSIRTVLTDALDQRRSGDRFRVYDREGRRCPRRGCRGAIRRILQNGRSTFFCPVCQR
jgi:formamidopyrimidine-DNA glycosylase